MADPTDDGVPLTSMAHPGSEDYQPPPDISVKDPERKTMVGRVAYQLWRNIGKQLSLEEEARRVILAMRDPTEEMKEAGSMFCQECADSLDAWHAMIDTALKEPT